MAAVKRDTRKPDPEIRITEILGVIGNIQRNIDNLDEWMKPVEVVPSQNKNDKARIVHEGPSDNEGLKLMQIRVSRESAGATFARR